MVPELHAGPVVADSENSERTSSDAENAPTEVNTGTDPVERLGRAVADLTEELKASHERAAARERVIDRLHEDNERLRAGERHLLLRPVQTDLVRLRNDLLRQAETIPGDYTVERMAEMLTTFGVSVELILERCGIHVLRVEPGSPFDTSRHRAVGAVPAPSVAVDSTVAEAMADGYVDAVTDRVVTPAAVRVYRWEAGSVDVPVARHHAD